MFKTLFVLMLWGVSGLKSRAPCNKVPGVESYVCVCDSSYCDDYQPITDDEISQFMHVYTSSCEGGRMDLARFSVRSPVYLNDSSDAAVVVVDIRRPLQEIVGFGGALTDSAVQNIRSLPSAAQARLLQMYFSPEQLRYNIIRVPMAATDFSTHPYTYNSVPFDLYSAFFNLAKEDYHGKIPMIKEAKKLAKDRVKLLAGAWVAPSWMKSDGKILSGGHLKPFTYSAWARYYINFLRGYEREGLSFWAVTAGNEPLTAIVSAGWSAQEMCTFITHALGPALRQHFPHLRLLLLDDTPEYIPQYLTLLDNPESAKYIDGLAVHPYTGSGPLQTNLDLAHDRHPDCDILQTELSVGVLQPQPVVLGSWSRAEIYAIALITGFNHWATGFVDWNMALDSTGGPTFIGNNIDAAIIVKKDEGVFYKQPLLYVIAHFSAFIPPGSRVLPVSVTPDTLLATAALTPARAVVLVLLNRENRTVSASIREGAAAALITVPARSIVTAIYRPT